MAAGQAAKRRQWAVELWKATEEKRAALAALRQSEETLHQVWQQVRPPGVEPLSEVPSAAVPQGGAPGAPAKGCAKAKRRNHRRLARAQAASSLLAGGSAGTSESPEEPLTWEEPGNPGVQSPKQEPLGPVGPFKQVGEVHQQVGGSCLLQAIKQEQPKPASCLEPESGEPRHVGVPKEEEDQLQVGGSCLLKAIKQEQPELASYLEPESGGKQQVGVPYWPRSIKQEEGRASWAKYQENQ